MKTFFAISTLAEYLHKDNAVSQAGANGKRKRYYLHIDFGIKQFVKGLFAGGVPYRHAGGVPYRHLKVLDQERTNHLVQDQEQEIPATERNETWGHYEYNALTPGLELTPSPSTFGSSSERTD